MPDAPEVGSVWFDDGNLIVITEPKVFRLYQGLLARRSPVIRDLLSIPGADIVIYDADRRVLDVLGRDTTGCVVVRFSDKPQEVEWFLSAFTGDSLFGQFSGDLSVLTGILRLATKYEGKSLQKLAVECLERLLGFPTGASSGEILRLMRQQEEGVRWMNGMFSPIDVASTVGVPWLLRVVFWCLQFASLSDILSHPEWKELPEERQSHYLFCRERALDDAFRTFAVVARLHRGTAHDATHPCHFVNDFKDTLHREFTRSGSKAINDFDWEGYAATLPYAICTANYADVEREVAVESFRSLQKYMGIPDRHELITQREKFFQDVSVDSAYVNISVGCKFCRD